jgi:hypothetical protein
MNREQQVALRNILADKYGREFIRWVLRECGIDLLSGMSYRAPKTAHEFGLDLLHEIMYNETDKLKLIISEQQTLEVRNGRGNGDTDDD